MLKTERQGVILELLEGDGVVTVSDLAERFNTSQLTIRRDLTDMHNQGILSRTHGGAVLRKELNAHFLYESGSFEDRRLTRRRVKERIGIRAAQLVSNTDSIVINGGSTVTEFARALRSHKDLNVITNGLTVAYELGKQKNSSVYVLPGVLDLKKMTAVCDRDGESFPDVCGHSVFLGVTSINTRFGAMISTAAEAEEYRKFIESAAEVTILTDSSKFNAPAMYRICDMSKITRIISDDLISRTNIDSIEEQGIELILVKGDDEA